MKTFFDVKSLQEALACRSRFTTLPVCEVPLAEATGRVLAADVAADLDLPGFTRSTMDGFAVAAASTFGASEANPAYLAVGDTIRMGATPETAIGAGEAARISTGGMLPPGADSVVMVEHTELLDDTTIEVYKSVAPGQHVIRRGEDFACGTVPLSAGLRLRPAHVGLLAAFGKSAVTVFRYPVVGIISTGDEVVPVDEVPTAGQIRDVNSFTLAALVTEAGGRARTYGIVKDDFDALAATCRKAISEADMVLISGGSSVGTRDYTIEAISSLPDAEVLFHGITISPGKPTILARVGKKPFWGLPGHVVSAMVVFSAVVKPFLDRLQGEVQAGAEALTLPAVIDRSISSAQGRVDYVRVRLRCEDDHLVATPVLGKSGLINTMVSAHGLITIGMNVEGLDRGSRVGVRLL